MVNAFEFNPDLQIIVVLCSRILTTALKKYSASNLSSVILMILKKIEDWNAAVPRTMRITEQQQALTQFEIKLKKLEIRNFPHLFQKAREVVEIAEMKVFINLVMHSGMIKGSEE